ASQKEKHDQALRAWDEQQTGYPDLKLGHVLDMAQAIMGVLAGDVALQPRYLHPDGFRMDAEKLLERAKKIKLKRKSDQVNWWRKTVGQLRALYRSKLFDRDGQEGPDKKKITTLNYEKMLGPGHVVVVDMHGLESPHHRNLAISELLRGVMEAQDALYGRAL